MRRRHCPSLEHINLERQQQSLFDLSILKLQQEQLRHGVEPRLLRFVLINNALRALQGHMFFFGDEDDFSFDSAPDRCGGTTESFLSNTFKDGGLPTTPTSPPTPVKVIKLETTLSDQSPLIASTPFQSFVADSSRSSTSDDEREGVEAASMPPCERVGAVVTCAADGSGSGREGEHRNISEILTATMTSIEERPANFSTTTTISTTTTTMTAAMTAAGDDSLPCVCRRASLGKRRREEVEGDNSSGCPCQCSVVQVRDEGERVESMCVGGEEEERAEDNEEEAGGSSSGGSASKKMCNRPSALTLNGTKRINRMNGLNSVYTVLGLDQLSPPTSSSSSPSSSTHDHLTHSPPCSPEETDEDSSTPSPIDFTKVDPTLYDYDTKAPLLNIPTQDPHSISSSPAHPHSVSAPDSNGHAIGVGRSGSAQPATASPDSSTTQPSSSSLPCPTAVAPPLSSTDDMSCSAAESVTSPTLAITATSTTFSLPSSSAEYPLMSSSDHDCSHVSDMCPTSAVKSNLIGDSSSNKCSSSSCSLEGLVSAQNGELVHNESERTDNENSISNGLNGGVPSSPEGAENDFLEDIEHIVSLLMT